jgi:hypothetical protein
VLVGVAAVLPAPQVDPSRVKAVTRQILNRPEFRPPKRNVLQAAWHWVTTELGKLLNSVFGRVGSFGSSWATFLVVVVVAILAIGLVVLTVRRRGGRSRSRKAGPVVLRRDGPSRSPADWRAEAAAHQAAGRWRDALRCRYRALVAELVGRGLVEEIPGRTSGEYRQDVNAVVPAAGPAFDRATDLFEQAWYGDRPIGPEDQDQFDDLARRVLTPVGGTTWDVPGSAR